MHNCLNVIKHVSFLWLANRRFNIIIKYYLYFIIIFNKEVEVAKTQMQTVRRTVEATNEICEKCGKPMVIKWGRKGRFMSCSGWPECRNAKSIATGTACPECKKGQLVARRAKTGRGRTFYGCTRFPDCRFIAQRLPKPDEDITARPTADQITLDSKDSAQTNT